MAELLLLWQFLFGYKFFSAVAEKLAFQQHLGGHSSDPGTCVKDSAGGTSVILKSRNVIGPDYLVLSLAPEYLVTAYLCVCPNISTMEANPSGRLRMPSDST